MLCMLLGHVSTKVFLAAEHAVKIQTISIKYYNIKGSIQSNTNRLFTSRAQNDAHDVTDLKQHWVTVFSSSQWKVHSINGSDIDA